MNRRRADQDIGPPAQRRRLDLTALQEIRGIENRRVGDNEGRVVYARNSTALNQTNQRRVEYEIVRSGRAGRIFQINVHPVAIADLQSTQQVIGAVIAGFQEALNRYRIPLNSRGLLSVQNNRTFTEHALPNPLPFNQALPALFQQILDDIMQSNETVNMADLDWKFTLVQERRGGAPEVVKPKIFKGKMSDLYERTWKSHNVNCAAFAICSQLYTVMTYAERINKTRSLCFQMRWGEDCNFHELSKFVEVYSEYRLTVQNYALRKFLLDVRGDEYTDPAKHLKLYYDDEQRHFGCYSVKSLKSSEKECQDCGKFQKSGRFENCSCSGPLERKPRAPPKPKACDNCGELGKHTCPKVTCKSCSHKHPRGEYWRCLVEPKSDTKEIWVQGDLNDGTKTKHFAYDFESRIKREETNIQVITGFNYDADGLFDTENLLITGTGIAMHQVDFVHVKSVYGDEEYSFEGYLNLKIGDNCLQDFITFCFNHNHRNNVMWAHNASGYDARFVFDSIADYDPTYQVNPLMRGGKLMQLVIKGRKGGKECHDLIFRDSLLQTPGSLASLAKDYCAGKMLKGFFPHLFDRYNTPGYKGEIPHIKYFDYSSHCKSKADYLKFLDWHSNWHTENGPVYDLDYELKKYCKNDVDVLCCILKGFSETLTEKFKMNPLNYTTCPSYAHNVSLTQEHFKRELDPESEDYEEKYKATIPNDWAVLNPQEYFFARKALRGGRTDVRKIYHQVSQEDWDRGVRIRYQDICSEYPWQQIRHQFPVGLPTIEIYDMAYMPCKEKAHVDVKCNCVKKGFVPGSKVVVKPQPTKQEILDDPTFAGIVCATVQPPKMIHPTLVHYDENLNKCVASCKRLTGYFTSVEFIQALKDGYELVKLHRLDRYLMSDSKWREFTFVPYLQKMINSKNEPRDLEGLAKAYRDKFSEFDPDFAEDCYRDILATHGKWGKNPAKKHAFKIVLNSGWGKHAENPIKANAHTFEMDNQEDMEKIYDMFANLEAKNLIFNSCIDLGRNRVMYKTTPTANIAPNLHKGYLPAACFVSAYGRLQLHEQLKLLGDRVLMNDTDSIVYIYDPELYNIPEGGLLGDWEVEDIDTLNGGIREFVGMGPKTYAIKCDNGFTLTKAKGIRNSYAASTLVNFEEMKAHVLEYKAGGRKAATQVPTMNFVWMTGKGIKTTYSLKRLEFNFSDLKGKLNAEGYLLPFGYE